MKNKMIWTTIAASATALIVYLRRKARMAAMKTQLPVKATERHLAKAIGQNKPFGNSGSPE